MDLLSIRTGKGVERNHFRTLFLPVDFDLQARIRIIPDFQTFSAHNPESVLEGLRIKRHVSLAEQGGPLNRL
jgi:hypothetical protein